MICNMGSASSSQIPGRKSSSAVSKVSGLRWLAYGLARRLGLPPCHILFKRFRNSSQARERRRYFFHTRYDAMVSGGSNGTKRKSLPSSICSKLPTLTAHAAPERTRCDALPIRSKCPTMLSSSTLRTPLDHASPALDSWCANSPAAAYSPRPQASARPGHPMDRSRRQRHQLDPPRACESIRISRR